MVSKKSSKSYILKKRQIYDRKQISGCQRLGLGLNTKEYEEIFTVRLGCDGWFTAKCQQLQDCTLKRVNFSIIMSH